MEYDIKFVTYTWNLNSQRNGRTISLCKKNTNTCGLKQQYVAASLLNERQNIKDSISDRRRGAHLSFIDLLSPYVEKPVCNAWPVRLQTYGYLPSRRLSRLISCYSYQIIFLGNRGIQGFIRAANLRRIHNLSIARPTPNPLRHLAYLRTCQALICKN